MGVGKKIFLSTSDSIRFKSCVWASEGFFLRGGAVGDFPKIFSRGAKSGEIWFLPLEIEKTTFFANNFKIQESQGPLVPPFRRPCDKPVCCYDNSCDVYESIESLMVSQTSC